MDLDRGEPGRDVLERQPSRGLTPPGPPSPFRDGGPRAAAQHLDRVAAWLARADIADELDAAEDNTAALAELLGQDAATALTASSGWPALDAVLIAAENRGFDVSGLIVEFHEPGITAEAMRLAMAAVVSESFAPFDGVPAALLQPDPDLPAPPPAAPTPSQQPLTLPQTVPPAPAPAVLPETLAALTFARVARYLRDTGWTEQERYPDLSVWQHPDNTSPHLASVPLTTTATGVVHQQVELATDQVADLRDLLDLLAQVEGRPQPERMLWRELTGSSGEFTRAELEAVTPAQLAGYLAAQGWSAVSATGPADPDQARTGLGVTWRYPSAPDTDPVEVQLPDPQRSLAYAAALASTVRAIARGEDRPSPARQVLADLLTAPPANPTLADVAPAGPVTPSTTATSPPTSPADPAATQTADAQTEPDHDPTAENSDQDTDQDVDRDIDPDADEDLDEDLGVEPADTVGDIEEYLDAGPYGWSLTEQQPDEYGFTQRWDRGTFALALSWTADERLVDPIHFYDTSRWDQASRTGPWRPYPLTTRAELVAVWEQAGEQGVVVPAYQPGRWNLTATVTAEQAALAVQADPDARLVTRDGEQWRFADTGEVADLAAWVPPLHLRDRDAVLRHVLQPAADVDGLSAQVRPLVLALITGRAAHSPVGSNPAAIQAELERLAPAEVVRRTLAAAAGRPSPGASGFDPDRAAAALQRLAEGDPALPANAVGCLIEVQVPDRSQARFEIVDGQMVDHVPLVAVRGRVVEVLAAGDHAVVRIQRDQPGPDGHHVSAQDLPFDAVLAVLALPGQQPTDLDPSASSRYFLLTSQAATPVPDPAVPAPDTTPAATSVTDTPPNTTGEPAAPPRPPAPRFHPTSQDDLAPSGEVRRVRANIAALRTMRTIQAEDRPATSEEQGVLAGWSGWGAVAGVFDEDRERWAWARAELADLMDLGQARAAARNTINAHYTDLSLVQPIWDAVAALGFDGGQVLEPGCGSGNFLAAAPAGAHLLGVELDPTTAAIAAALYPDTQVLAESFADTRLPEQSMDLVIGNVPFGDFGLTDPRYNPDTKLRIHNHFILKSLALTRPGGLVCVLTSRYTLDATNPDARRRMAQMADLVGAIRLPGGAHRRAAGTDAVTDLLILRRREPDPAAANQAEATGWERAPIVDINGAQVPVNEYFLAHPDMVLGELRSNDGSAMYRRDDLAVVNADLPTLPAQLTDVLAGVVDQARDAGLVFAPTTDTTPAGPIAVVGADAARREGYLAATDTGFTRIESGQLVPYEVPDKQAGELRALLGLRDAVVELLETEAALREDTPHLDELRRRLNTRYDAYARTYGPINRFSWRRTGRVDEATGEERMARVRPPVWRMFRVDPFAAPVAALELFDSTTQTAAKAAVFTRRVIAPRQPVLGVDNPADALAVCLDLHGQVRLDEIARLLGVDEAAARDQLGTLVFDDPAAGRVVPAADYLSGNVRVKLAQARAAAEHDERFGVNVDALVAVIPRDLTPDEIHAQLGAAWIDAPDIQRFLSELLEDKTIRVEHPGASVWAVRGNKYGVNATQVWGTEFAPATAIAQALLEQRPVLVYDTIGTGSTAKRVINADKTVEAQGKADAIAARFSEWVWEDPVRAKRLAEHYNETFNALVLRGYDDAELSLPGLALTFEPRSHQVAAVARMINEPAVLLAHEVGAGKTAEMAIGCMELRRLGLVNKPAVVVPNNMLEQFAREWHQLYPRAKLLIATKEDFAGPKRREFVARCATGDWDAVVMTRTAFERIPMSRSAQRAYLDKELEAARELLSRGKNSENGLTVKRLEAALIRAEERLKRKLETVKDSGLTFEATGIDYLVVDEAHGYKNLRTISAIPGAAIEGSQRASDLDMKLHYLRERHGGRCATFATATPIANSVTEAYVMQRYLRPDLLDAANMPDFDCWAGTFGESVTAIELSPAGDRFRMNTRFAKFRNVPELLRMWHMSADIKTGEDLGLPVPLLVQREDGQRQPKTVVVPGSAELAEFIGELGARAEAIRDRKVDPDQDNMLMVSGDGRKAALDLRLVGRSTNAPTKLDYAAEEIFTRWQAHRDDIFPFSDKDDREHPVTGAFQIVFCDLGTPNPNRWNAYDELRELLVAKGMPRAAVRFAHEATTDQAKGELFAACRAGQVAVLVGSTEKMGVGTNVQNRAIALHHLDCPWRPADVQQRNGRILRQGNLNAEVEIINYVTEGSFDAYMWQTVTRKGTFIAQVMRGRLDVREMEDIGDNALSYNEVKALATGNPLLLDHAEAQATLTRLERLQRAHDRAQNRLEHTIATTEQLLPGMQSYRDEIAAAVAQRVNTRGDAFAITLRGTRYTDRVKAGEWLTTLITDNLRAIPKNSRKPLGEIGTLGGLPVSVFFEQANIYEAEAVFSVGLDGNKVNITLAHLKDSKPSSLVTRLENALDRLDRLYTDSLDAIEKANTEVERAHDQLGKPFGRAEELAAARTRLAGIEAELESQAEPERDHGAAPTPIASGSGGGVGHVGGAGAGASLTDMAMHDAMVMAGMNPATATVTSVQTFSADQVSEVLAGVLGDQAAGEPTATAEPAGTTDADAVALLRTVLDGQATARVVASPGWSELKATLTLARQRGVDVTDELRTAIHDDPAATADALSTRLRPRLLAPSPSHLTSGSAEGSVPAGPVDQATAERVAPSLPPARPTLYSSRQYGLVFRAQDPFRTRALAHMLTHADASGVPAADLGWWEQLNDTTWRAVGTTGQPLTSAAIDQATTAFWALSAAPELNGAERVEWKLLLDQPLEGQAARTVDRFVQDGRATVITTYPEPDTRQAAAPSATTPARPPHPPPRPAQPIAGPAGPAKPAGVTIEHLAAVVAFQTRERVKADHSESVAQGETVSIVPGRVYTKIDRRHGGFLMVHHDTGDIYGIRGYGQVDKNKHYGTLATVDQWFWGSYSPTHRRDWSAREAQIVAATAGQQLDLPDPPPPSSAPARTAPGRPAAATGRTLVVHHSYQRGTLLLGTDKTDNIRAVFQKWRSRGFAVGGWDWSRRIANGTPRPGAWYLPKTRETIGSDATADHIGRTVRALREAGHTVRVDVDFAGLSESAQLRLRTRYSDVLDPPDQPASTAVDPAADPATPTGSAGPPPEQGDLRSRSRQLLAAATRTATAVADTEPDTEPDTWPDPEFEPPPDFHEEAHHDAGSDL